MRPLFRLVLGKHGDDPDFLPELQGRKQANFAKNGDPNGPGLPRWEPALDGSQLQELGERVGSRQDPYLALYGILDKMQSFAVS